MFDFSEDGTSRKVSLAGRSAPLQDRRQFVQERRREKAAREEQRKKAEAATTIQKTFRTFRDLSSAKAAERRSFDQRSSDLSRLVGLLPDVDCQRLVSSALSPLLRQLAFFFPTCVAGTSGPTRADRHRLHTIATLVVQNAAAATAPSRRNEVKDVRAMAAAASAAATACGNDQRTHADRLGRCLHRLLLWSDDNEQQQQQQRRDEGRPLLEPVAKSSRVVSASRAAASVGAAAACSDAEMGNEQPTAGAISSASACGSSEVCMGVPSGGSAPAGWGGPMLRAEGANGSNAGCGVAFPQPSQCFAAKAFCCGDWQAAQIQLQRLLRCLLAAYWHALAPTCSHSAAGGAAVVALPGAHWLAPEEQQEVKRIQTTLANLLHVLVLMAANANSTRKT
eukprot:GHVT01064697.1.p1 GENE.GHVT01064697.1~~GHVT01064697.1.p1  ORF type:complete len:394 (-),score=88.21 GHVT01064697.1:110-1291(-)